MLRITVCGDGPIAHSIALMTTYLGHFVRVLTVSPASWSQRLRGVLPDGSRIEGPLELVSESPADCIPESDVIMVCVPHSEIRLMLESIAPYLTSRTVVGGIPGFGGFGIWARQLLPPSTCIFGLQRIPFVVGAFSLGRSVRISGIRRQTYVGAMPAARSLAMSELISKMLAVRSVPVSHYINIELSPSNSIVNPARIYALFGLTEGPVRGKEFFTDWDQAASETLLQLDAELQSARRLIPRDTSFIAPILLQYDANDAYTLTLRFRRLKTLAGRLVPFHNSDGPGEQLAQSSYITEDVDFGLAAIRGILRLAGSSTPMADQILKWRSTIGPSIVSLSSLPGATLAASFVSIDALVEALD